MVITHNGHCTYSCTVDICHSVPLAWEEVGFYRLLPARGRQCPFADGTGGVEGEDRRVGTDVDDRHVL